MTNKGLVANLILKGFSSVIIQSLLLRELLIIFHGNELTLGIILCVWLLSGALGSILMTPLIRFFNQIRLFVLLQSLASIYFIFAIVLIRLAPGYHEIIPFEFFSLGAVAGLSMAALAFLSFCDGALFTIGFHLLASNHSKKNSDMARLYLLESLGFMLGGILFTFFFLSAFNSFQIAFIVGALTALAGFWLLAKDKNVSIKIVVILLFFLFCALFQTAPLFQEDTINRQWQGKNIAAYENSLFGNIAVGKQLDQTTIYYDGLPLLSLPYAQMYFTEDFIHLPLLIKPEAQSLLFIGSAAGGPLTEALKYPVKKITYAEIDPVLINILLELKNPVIRHELEDARVHIEKNDGRSFIKTTKEKFDAVFINTALATSLVLNRYATKEFYAEIKNTLNPGGIAVFKTWGTLSSLSEEFKNINASMLKTLSHVYPAIACIPGDGFNLFIASTNPVDLNEDVLAQNLSRLNLETYLINPTYLKERLDKKTLKWFFDNVREKIPGSFLNQDLKPSGLYDALRLYYAQHSIKIARLFGNIEKIKNSHVFILSAALLLLWGIFCAKGKRYNTALFVTALSTGFFAMSTQIIALFLFQSLLGYLFKWVAILTASFMIGTCAATLWVSDKTKQLGNIKKIALVEGVLPAITVAFIVLIAGQEGKFLFSGSAPWFFSLISVSAGFLVGLEIPLLFEAFQKSKPASDNTSTRAAGLLYCMDLAGACLACLFIPLVLIPICGILATTGLLYLVKIGNAMTLNSLR